MPDRGGQRGFSGLEPEVAPHKCERKLAHGISCKVRVEMHGK